MISDEQLVEIEARRAKITQGKWESIMDWHIDDPLLHMLDIDIDGTDFARIVIPEYSENGPPEYQPTPEENEANKRQGEADADFICYAAEDISILLAEIKRLREVNKTQHNALNIAQTKMAQLELQLELK